MRKGSKEAKAWGRKMKRLRGTRKGMRRKTARRAYTGLKKKRRKTRSTRKGMRRKTARRAYTGLKRRVSRRKKSESAWNF
jgi:hypothetical protein|tara:strand:+ start:150 stop:389 length:240 start_codon:yes stop_codon:yes gene_type:complete